MPEGSAAPAKGSGTRQPKITRDMKMSDIIALVPDAAGILSEYGLHCFSCSLNTLDTLEQGCILHGFSSETVDALVDDINDAITEGSSRPMEITITKDAAESLSTLAEQEGHAGDPLIVTLDERGSFCMEFANEDPEDHYMFIHSDVSSIRVFASALTLFRIGGSTIDFREGRFKLDLPEDSSKGSCCQEGACACDAFTPASQKSDSKN